MSGCPPTQRPGGVTLAAGGHELAASALLDVMNQPDKQRAACSATARKDVSFLADPISADWITDRGDNRARFDTKPLQVDRPALFIVQRGTRIRRPLTAALTRGMVLPAGVARSRRSGAASRVPWSFHWRVAKRLSVGRETADHL